MDNSFYLDTKDLYQKKTATIFVNTMMLIMNNFSSHSLLFNFIVIWKDLASALKARLSY